MFIKRNLLLPLVLVMALTACEKTELIEPTIEASESFTVTTEMLEGSKLQKDGEVKPPNLDKTVPYFISIQLGDTDKKTSNFILRFNSNERYNGDCNELSGISWNISEQFNGNTSKYLTTESQETELEIAISNAIDFWNSEVTLTANYGDCESVVSHFCLEMTNDSDKVGSNLLYPTCGNVLDDPIARSGTLTMIIP